MDSDNELEDLCSRVIFQLHKICDDLKLLTEKYMQVHGFDFLLLTDISEDSASTNAVTWLGMTTAERLKHNITAYLALEKKLERVVGEQAQLLSPRETDLHGNLHSMLQQVSALRGQLEQMGTILGSSEESTTDTDEVEGADGRVFEVKLRGYKVLTELNVWVVRSVKDVRKIRRERTVKKEEMVKEGE
ncbi:ciliary neurotrophic factor [Bombina bombina]|uniref:ciliary neurotrophic factor n=1 Tax=Bombina bombina TaxID=8345 RepID=UPI00235A5E05|nr:ciliary neurotrophic factor [Bombina bombina]XP_053547664.1 ciliary neurotrophic factor [Bombina bombina]